MTAALEGGPWSAASPVRSLPPGKTQYPFYRRVGGPQGRSGRTENPVPTGIRSRTVKPVAQSLYRLSYPAHKASLVLLSMPTQRPFYMKMKCLVSIFYNTQASICDAFNFVSTCESVRRISRLLLQGNLCKNDEGSAKTPARI